MCCTSNALLTRSVFRQSELVQALINFPYSDCIEKLDAVRVVNIPEAVHSVNTKPYTTFVTKLGAAADQVDSQTRKRLISVIQTRGGTVPATANTEDEIPPSPPSSNDGEIGADTEIAMYTMRLNEWATKRYKSTSFDPKHITVDPPLWEVKLLVEGETFVGRAKKQKSAKHIACKQACDKLQIDGRSYS